MTLAASERSLLIRNKFRSVLQLRIQNRRQNEISADLGKSTSPSQKTEDEKSEALRLSDDGATQKLPPSGVNAETAKERTHRHKKARQVQELSERVPRLSGTTEQQYELRLPLENLSSACFTLPSDVFEDDISSCSSSSSPTEQHGTLQSAAFPSLPLLSGDQLLSDFSATGTPQHHSPGHTQSSVALLPATEGIRHPLSVTLGEPGSMATSGRPNGVFLACQTMPLLPKTALPPSPTCSSALPSLNFNHQPRPRKPRDTKPKMKKLKYHQYIPPDQRGGSGTGAGAKQKSPTQSIDPAYSHLVKQQQVILQLQILQNQQQQQQQQQQPQLQPPQITVVPSGDAGDPVKSSGAMPLNPQPVPATTNHTPLCSKPVSKPEFLPANLVDLTVSELRQQLRKRGLPVSGTKPALLQRLRPFQLPQPCVAPAPLCQLGNSETVPAPLSPNHSPISSASSGSDSPSQCPSKHIYVQNRKIPNGILSDAPNGILSDVPNAFTNATSVSLAGEQCTVFIAPASTASGTPSPSLPMSSSSPLQCGTPWRTESEQQQQQQEELSVELEMRERIKSRPRDHLTNSSQQSYGAALHPFLQQDPGCLIGKPKTEAPTEVLFTQVYSCQPCDVIGQDFELPVQITASPVQTSPAVRSLEEELQEAIQKAQMDPRQSIDDILDEPITCNDPVVAECDGKSTVDLAPSPSPLPQTDLSQASHQQHKDDIFLPSPLCSSLLLEMPPSPAVIPPSHVVPAPPPLPPPPLCVSPLPSRRKSRKRRAPPSFDAAEWLETLTCGLRPLTPPAAPFVEPDFTLDADLNVNRVLDLMVEQW